MTTARDRMVHGEDYNSRDAALLATAHRARALLADFSATPSTDADERRRILSELFGGLGDGVWIEPPFFCDYGENIYIGSEAEPSWCQASPSATTSALVQEVS